MEVFVSAQSIADGLTKVMVVSSDENLTQLLEFLLEEDGFQAISKKPELAIDTLLEDQPEAVFFDLACDLSLLDFIQQACPATSIFTVQRSEFSSSGLGKGVRGFVSTPVDYRGVKKLLSRNLTAPRPSSMQGDSLS